MSCSVGRRLRWDSKLLWLWCRPAAAALIRPLIWEPPYAAGAALKKKEKEKSGSFPVAQQVKDPATRLTAVSCVQSLASDVVYIVTVLLAPLFLLSATFCVKEIILMYHLDSSWFFGLFLLLYCASFQCTSDEY